MSIFNKCRIIAELIITVIFIFLKIYGCIKWRWFWVFTPLWAGACFSLAYINALMIRVFFECIDEEMEE